LTGVSPNQSEGSDMCAGGLAATHNLGNSDFVDIDSFTIEAAMIFTRRRNR
jgi:hypothetical protein